MLTLTKDPVYNKDGKIINIFPGYLPIEYEFKREDISITSVTQGTGENSLVTIAGDYTGSIQINDYNYVYSEGSGYTYDKTGRVLDVYEDSGNTKIELDIPFIIVASGGYLNYKQNWVLEIKIVNPDNDLIDLLGFSIRLTGTDSGEISADTNIINYVNKQLFLSTSGEIKESRIKYNIKYRESWRENLTNSFILNNNPVISITATESFEIDQFVTPFEIPNYYYGYPAGIGLIHSDANNEAEQIKFNASALDINKNTIIEDVPIIIFDLGSYGLLFSAGSGSEALPTGTEYLLYKASTINTSEYDSSQYSNEYNI